MANNDQILEALKNINSKLDVQGAAIIRLEQGQAHTNTALEAVQSGQEDLVEHVRKNVATKLDVDVVEKSLKADIYDLHAKVITIDAKLVRKVQNHEKRLDDAGIPNPDKH